MRPDTTKTSVGVVGALLAAMTLAAFWPVLGNDFITFDDPFYVTTNPHVSDGLSWDNVRWAITAMHASNWHPLTWISHMLDCSLFGLNPRGHHAVNLGLHILNSLVLLLVLRTMTRSLWRSALVAALFAVHPLHVESVAWVSERKDLLSTFWGLLAMLAYSRYAGQSVRSRWRKTWTYGVALSCFALSLLSKPMWVTLPCLLLLLDYWPLGRSVKSEVRSAKDQSSIEGRPGARNGWRIWRSLVLEKLPFFVLSAGSCMLTVMAQSQSGAVAAVGDISFPQRLVNSVIAYGWYVLRLFWPTDLAIIYPLFPTRPLVQTLGAVVLVVTVTSLAVWQVRRRPQMFVGWFWFAGLLVPVIGLVQVGMQAYADRYTYVPYVGLFIVIAWTAAEWVGTSAERRTVCGVAAVVVVGCCLALTNRQTRYWRNAETVFTRAIDVTKDNYIALNDLGYSLAERREFSQAIEYYQAALKVAPRYAHAFNNLACAYLGQHKTNEALHAFYQAVNFQPSDARFHMNLGSALHDTGDYTNAILEYERAVQLDSRFAEAYYNLGNSLLVVGRRDEAEAHFKQALTLNSKYAEAHLNLALSLLARGQNEEALQHCQQAVAVKPTWFPAHVGLASALKALNRLDEAVAQYRHALQLQPDHAGTQYQFGTTLVSLGRADEATIALAEAARLKPANPEYQFALAVALEQAGRAAEAIPHYRTLLKLAPDVPDGLNNLAWILATHPDASLRDGAEAVRLAERACQRTEFRQPMLVGTLAAAYAEAGRFADAVKTAEQARHLAQEAGDTAVAAKNGELLELYRTNKAYRQTP